MYHDFNYEATLASSLRAQWQLDDVLREDQDLDFGATSCPRAWPARPRLGSLNAFEQRTLNQIAAHEYLSMFGIVEEFILPFLLDHARPHLMDDDWRVRALLNFASEEAKHIHLFKRYHAAFKRGFPVDCQVIGPSEAIGAGNPPPRSARGRPRHPDDRVDDPAALSGQHPRRRRPRPALQEPDEASTGSKKRSTRSSTR